MRKIREVLHHGHDSTVPPTVTPLNPSTATATTGTVTALPTTTRSANTGAFIVPKAAPISTSAPMVANTNPSLIAPTVAPVVVTQQQQQQYQRPILPQQFLQQQPIIQQQQQQIPAVRNVKEEPVRVERVAKPVVVQERFHPIEKEEIQPIIHREREQLEIKQITERLHETAYRPMVVEERSLAPEVKPAVIMRAAPITPNLIQPTVQVEAAQRSQVVHAPIVQETIKRTVIEEVQPVISRDVFAPTVIKQIQPIYEKIVEAPRVFRETIPVRELGVTHIESFSALKDLDSQRFSSYQGLTSSPIATTTTTTTTTTSTTAAPLSQQPLTGKIIAAEQNLEQKIHPTTTAATSSNVSSSTATQASVV